MNTRGFTGLAGTGKTTRLLRELEAQLAVQPLTDGQRVLALTFMHGSRFRLIDRLASMTSESPAVAWLRSAGTVEDLTFVHRTNLSGLMKAATALRNGTPLVDGPGFKLVGLPVPKPAASFVAQPLGGEAPGDAVIFSPARPEKSKFVRTVLDLIGQNSYGKQHARPFSIRWEKTTEILETECLAALGLRAAQHLRSFETHAHGGRRAMTIHQAKNREFPVVIVLWPFGVPGEDALARRWLYNAVTRAKKRAIVVVEDPKRDRLKKAPFI